MSPVQLLSGPRRRRQYSFGPAPVNLHPQFWGKYRAAAAQFHQRMLPLSSTVILRRRPVHRVWPGRGQYRQCPGCPGVHQVGVGCTRCWTRVPWPIRKTITRGSDTEADTARAEARAWLLANQLPALP